MKTIFKFIVLTLLCLVACKEKAMINKKQIDLNADAEVQNIKLGPYRRLEPEVIDNNTLILPAVPLNVLDIHGNLFTLNDVSKSKYTLLTFTDKGCSHCEAFYPELELFLKDKLAKQIDCVVIQLNSSAEDIIDLKKAQGYNFKMLVGNDDVFIRYDVEATPTSFLLDKNHNIVNIGSPNTVEEIVQFFDLRNDM